MAFRGNFTNANAVDTAAPHSPRLNWGTGVNPAHSESARGNDQGFPALKNPRVPELPIHIDDSFDPELAESPYFPNQDQEPKGHDGLGGGPRSSADPYGVMENSYAKHQDNRGATLKSSMPMVMRSVDQTFATPREQSLPASPNDGGSGISGQALRALRGHNALAANNPGSPDVNFSGDYLRQGYEISRITDRVMRRKTFRHTKRNLHLNLASIAHETAAQTGDNYSPYSSPFAGGIGRVVSGISTPMQRREPRPWDEDVTTDGSEQYAEDTSQMNAWGL